MSSQTFYQPSVSEEYKNLKLSMVYFIVHLPFTLFLKRKYSQAYNVALTFYLGNVAGIELMKTRKIKYRHKQKSRPDVIQ